MKNNNNNKDNGVEVELELESTTAITAETATAIADQPQNHGSNSNSNNEKEPPQQQQQQQQLSSHFRRPDLSRYWRYGVPIYILSTLALLLASDIGSGIQAILMSIPAPEDRWSTITTTVLADESIFTSVRQLWHTQSYALALFLVVCSIAWPYIKLILTLYAWMAPNNTQPPNAKRREKLLELLDVLGKWSFADVFVFCKILVAFRATIPGGAGTYFEVFLVAQWGFYGFVLATILSLISTHVVLYHHRSFLYYKVNNNNNTSAVETNNNNTDNSQQTATKSTTTIPPPPMTIQEAVILSMALLAGLACYLYGCVTELFQVSRTRGMVETLLDDYSIVSIGSIYVDSTRDQSPGDKWIQFLWFWLTLVMPILSTLLMLMLLLVVVVGVMVQQQQPHQQQHDNNKHHDNKKTLLISFMATEIAFCWNCGEVIVLSTLFAVLQIPEFGDGIIDTGCSTCYVIDSTLYFWSGLLPLLVGSVVNMVVGLWIYKRLHPVLFVLSGNEHDNDDEGDSNKDDHEGERSSSA